MQKRYAGIEKPISKISGRRVKNTIGTARDSAVAAAIVITTVKERHQFKMQR